MTSLVVDGTRNNVGESNRIIIINVMATSRSRDRKWRHLSQRRTHRTRENIVAGVAPLI